MQRQIPAFGPCGALRRLAPLVLGVAAAFAATDTSLATGLPIQIDGDYSDWTPESRAGTDPTGDSGASDIDFTELYLANDGDWLYLRFDTTIEIQGDEQQNIVVAFDTDQNPATGSPIGGPGGAGGPGSIGAELIWRLGNRSGTFYTGTTSLPISHADIGLVLGPTVSDTQLEFCLDRTVQLFAQDLFPQASFDVLVRDNTGGDILGPVTYTFSDGETAVPSIALTRDDPNHVRIASYNVENDGLFDNGAQRMLAIDHLLEATDADIWIFCETWNHSAAQVALRLEEFLPSGAGSSWHTVKLDQGNVIATRMPILDSWLVLEGSRLTAALVDLRPRYDTDLLVIANHWSCCTADDNRQEQADALIAFLRDARTTGGVIDLVAETPIVAAGDFNLVGWRRQYETLVTGDIEDNGTFGPDSPPDWDGSAFDLATPRHPDARFIYTWRDDGSSFYPGKLDFFAYTGSAATLHNHFVLETRGMSPASLAAAGLATTDTGIASDHAPVVGDISVDATTGGPGTPGTPVGTGSLRLEPAHPNPFQNSTTLGFETSAPGPVIVSIFDSSGRQVREFRETVARPNGKGQIQWDGRDDGQHQVPAGSYVYRLAVGDLEEMGTVVRLR